MFQLLIPISCFFFLLTLIPGRHRPYAAVIAWTTIIIVFIGGLSSWIEESNILYPVMAVLSIPFLVITIRLILRRDDAIFSLTRAAAVAFTIYAPFAFIEEIGTLLIMAVVHHTSIILQFIGYPISLALWNTFQNGFFRVEIFLACTGIQAIAIMLGVASAVPTTRRQKCLAFLLIVPTIYILNLFRNAAVIIAYTNQYFAWLPDISGNKEYGYSSFFWAHNVFAEGFALIFLVALAYTLFKLIPALGDFAGALVQSYEKEIKSIFDRGTQSSQVQKD